MRQKLLIEVALCERCGDDRPWRLAGQARPFAICQRCGSADVSRCEREQTPAELASIIETLRARSPHLQVREAAKPCRHGYWSKGGRCRREVCE